MLDATDSEAISTTVVMRRVHGCRGEEQKVAIATCDGTTPRITVRTRGTKRTGSTLT
jgi:hypothetical protein